MDNFRHIVFAAVVAGILAGCVNSLIQRVQVIPLVLTAETYETPPAASSEHSHEHAYEPTGVARTLWTVVADVLIGIGFALLLLAVYSLLNRRSIITGILLGLAGYTVFFVVPGLGLHPELPGTPAAPLFPRQAWWWLAVTCAASALALIFLQRKWSLRALGLALIVIPFVLGAPEAIHTESDLPAGLEGKFIIATALANAAFWLVLGTVSTWLYNHGASKTIHAS